jgi:hypothetical protein
MAVDEGSRHRLHQKLDRGLGAEEANALMGLLPPTGFEWSQIVTKDDLRVAIGSLRHELHADMERLYRRVVTWTSSVVLAAVGMAFAAARFV